ncbi:MAG: hypothetical protein H6644_07400 [Caldilineaceae bacterium]|nr:hypothetical protein [Caldilineaceae bacterium]
MNAPFLATVIGTMFGTLLWSIVALAFPAHAYAQEADYPLAAAPNQQGDDVEPVRYVGNYCGAFGGVSLHEEPERSFVVDVPGTPVAAYLYWSGRDRLSAAGDDNLAIAHNGAGPVAVTADVALRARSDGGYNWFTYVHDLHDDTPALVSSGRNEYTVGGLDVTERHGAGVLVIYENEQRCPYQQIDLFFGNDVFYKGWDGSSGPNSEVTCVDVPPPPRPIEIDIQMFVGGIENPLRSDSIWYATGSGDRPTNLVDTPFAVALDEQLAGLTGNEFDNYDTFVQDPQPIMVDAGDTWACFQIESPNPPNPGHTQGISATWINLAVRIPLAGIAITPDGVNPLNAPHTFTVTVESSVGFQSIEIVPSIVPPPDEQTDTCATPVIDGPLATCTVTINSSTPGIFTATAAATLDLGTLTATIVTNGRGNNSGPAIKEYVAGPAIALEKATNGVDADLPTGPQIKVGDPVTWTYTVTNVGNVPLRDVAVSDDQGVAVTCPADVLGVGASMVCTGQGFAREGQYANIGSVTARDADGRTVAATDPSHYVGYIPATLGDRVFADINPDGTTPQEILGGNGVQDVGEHGIDGIIVQLYTDDHVLVAQTVTRDGGFYEFTDLPPGDYYLVFINPFVDGVWTVPNNGGDDVDSDGVPSLPIVVDPGIPGDLIRTDVITLDPGENDRTWDAGLVGYSSSGSSALGDRIWLDQDKDGVQGNAAAEPGQEGIPVVLYRVREGGVLQRQRATVSDAAGLYRFDGLDTGSYVLEFLPPAEFRVSPLASGADRNLDSDADQTRGRTQTIFLPPLYDDMSWDAGIYTVPTALDGGDEPGQPATHFIYMPLLRR